MFRSLKADLRSIFLEESKKKSLFISLAVNGVFSFDCIYFPAAVYLFIVCLF